MSIEKIIGEVVFWCIAVGVFGLLIAVIDANW